MDPRQNANMQPPDTQPGAQDTPPPPPARRVSTQYVAMCAVLAMSVATTFAMRKYGMGEGLKFQHTDVRVSDIDTPLVDNAKFGRIMDRLATSNTPMQIPVDQIDKNPFLLGREGTAITEGPVADDGAERAAREAERARLEEERRIADLDVAFARLTLNTVMTGGTVSVARINSQIVGLDEVVDGLFRVVSITPEGVDLEAEGRSYHLDVNSMVNPRNTGPGGRTPQTSSHVPPRRP